MSRDGRRILAHSPDGPLRFWDTERGTVGSGALRDLKEHYRAAVNPDGTRVTTTWNFENQPTQYNQPGNVTYPVVTMTYNADNQRVEKQA